MILIDFFIKKVKFPSVSVFIRNYETKMIHLEGVVIFKKKFFFFFGGGHFFQIISNIFFFFYTFLLI